MQKYDIELFPNMPVNINYFFCDKLSTISIIQYPSNIIPTIPITGLGSTLVYIGYMILWFSGARQLDSVTQLVRALHRNRRAAGSIPARDLKLHFSLLFLVRSNKSA